MSCCFHYRIMDYHTCLIFFSLCTIAHNELFFLIAQVATAAKLIFQGVSNELHPIEELVQKHETYG